jgi:hypothetical protein
MFSDSTPLAGVGESAPAVEASSPVTPALQLQPGEPARQLQ